MYGQQNVKIGKVFVINIFQTFRRIFTVISVAPFTFLKLLVHLTFKSATES